MRGGHHIYICICMIDSQIDEMRRDKIFIQRRINIDVQTFGATGLRTFLPYENQAVRASFGTTRQPKNAPTLSKILKKELNDGSRGLIQEP